MQEDYGLDGQVGFSKCWLFTVSGSFLWYFRWWSRIRRRRRRSFYLSYLKMALKDPSKHNRGIGP